jgi:hypothetical protein
MSSIPAVVSRTSDTSKERTTTLAVLLFAFTSFLSAYLLFQVQLIVSKYILPWFGGSAGVWTTSMLVFQVLLLAGYAYAHLISVKLPATAQKKLHVCLLAVAFLAILSLSFIWPSAITPDGSWKSHVGGTPVMSVVLIITLAAGLPFFVLSTTAPLLQRWFANLGEDANAYRLYSVSNIGSLLGLLVFPFVLEPNLHLRSQGIMWSALFCLYLLACGWCGWHGLKSTRGFAPNLVAAPASCTKTPGTVRALWFFLAACATSLLLATTNLLCQEVISLPLLWIVPLALYLLSFILCFDHPRWYCRAIFHSLFAVGVFVLLLAMNYALRTTQIIVMPLLLFVVCMICHGELVRLKPDVQKLTSFYLTISAGGAVGGLFVSIVAPQVFRFFTEFQLTLGAAGILMLCCLWLDTKSWLFRSGLGLPAAVTVSGFAGVYAAARYVPLFASMVDRIRFYPLALLVATLVLVGAYLQRSTEQQRGPRPIQALVVAGVVFAFVGLYRSAMPESTLFLSERNFYGAIRVYELAQGGKALFHGHTLHGAQLNPPNERLPMAYYGPESGIGIFLQNHPKRASSTGLRVGVVGLGAGTLAAFGTPGDYFRYYEINPDVVNLSMGSRPAFTYIRNSAARVDMEQGDARLLLEQEAASGDFQRFDVLVLDAFSGDAVPVHLLTKEAFDTYWRHLGKGGVIAIHVSSRHINLLPVLNGLSAHYGAKSLTCFTNGSYPFLESLWVFIARDPEALQVQGLLPSPPPLSNTVPPRLWTDDYSDIFRLLY